MEPMEPGGGMEEQAPVEVEHQPEQARFVADTGEGAATLLYARPDDGTIDLRSTYVPSAARGRGIGEALVLEALKYARAEELRVIPTCWFVDEVLDRRTEYRDLVKGA